MKRLVVVTGDPDGPVVRHRVLALNGALFEAGFGPLDLAPIPHRLRDRLAFFRVLEGADLVVLSRKLFTLAEMRVLRACARRLVYDVDDAVLFRDPWRGRPVSHVRARRFRKTARTADLVTAGCPELVRLAREHAPDTPVRLAPTPVDTERYTPGGSPLRGAGFRVGWIGSHATRPYLRVCATALRRLVGAHADVTLCIMADAPPGATSHLEGVAVEFTPWSEEGEAPFLRSLDVGLMPLTDDPFSRGKCGFKLLQYMACGVPSVASPVGVNRDILADGAGLLAGDGDAWMEALTELRANPELRAAMGGAARAQAEERWSVRVLGPRFAEALLEACS